MTDIKKSIRDVLNERFSSPLYGTLILSWLACNWKIIYLTVFVSEDKIALNKIDYIILNYVDINNLVYFPLISTMLLLTIVPLIGNGAYWLSLIFDKWKSDKKNDIEKKRLLTLEQSIQLRELIAEQEKRFENLLSDRNTEINQLRLINDELKKSLSGEIPNISPVYANEQLRIGEVVEKITQNSELKTTFDTIHLYIQGGFAGLANQVTTHSLAFFISNNIIENKGKGMYNFTEFGQKVSMKLINEQFK